MVVVTPSIVTSVFESWNCANDAVGLLVDSIGIEQDCIILIPRNASSGYVDIVSIMLKNFRLHSYYFYAESLRQGNAIVLVRVNGGETADLTSVMLKECGATDIDAR